MAISGSMLRKRARLTTTKRMSPNFVFDIAKAIPCCQGGAEFGGFFSEFVEDAVDVVPIETDARGLAGELKTFEKRGKSPRDSVEDGDGFIIRVPGIRTQGCGTQRLLAAALFGFDDFPVAKDFGRIFGAFFTEDVRVTTNHFLVNFADDVVDGETAFFTGDLRMEEHLEKEITEFFGEFNIVAWSRALRELRRLLR